MIEEKIKTEYIYYENILTKIEKNYLNEIKIIQNTAKKGHKQ